MSAPTLGQRTVAEFENAVRESTHKLANAANHASVKAKGATLAAHYDASTRLAHALSIARRCPGIHQTDQETGETFAALINAALAKVAA